MKNKYKIYYKYRIESAHHWLGWAGTNGWGGIYGIWGTQYPKKAFAALSPNAQSQILALSGKQQNGYVRGVLFTAREIQGAWARTASGWVCLSYCEACA